MARNKNRKFTREDAKKTAAIGVISASAAAAVGYGVTSAFNSNQEEAAQFAAVTGSAFLGLMLTTAGMKYVLDNLQSYIESTWAKTGINITVQTLVTFALIESIKLTVPPKENLQDVKLDAESLLPLLVTVLSSKAAAEALAKRFTDKHLISGLAGIIAEVSMIIGGSWSIKEIAEALNFDKLDKMPLAGYAFGAAAATNGLVHMLLDASTPYIKKWRQSAYSFFSPKQTATSSADADETRPLLVNNAENRGPHSPYPDDEEAKFEF